MAELNFLNDDAIKVLNSSKPRALKFGKTTVDTALLFEAVQRVYAVEKERFITDSSKLKEVLGKYGINNVNFERAYVECEVTNESLYPELKYIKKAREEIVKSGNPIAPDTIADWLNMNGITSSNGQQFDETMVLKLLSVEKGLPLTTSVAFTDDAKNVLTSLAMKAKIENQQQGINDLLAALFAEKSSYTLFNVFSRISDDMKQAHDDAIDAGVPEEQLPPTAFDVNLLYEDMRQLLAGSTVREIKSLETDEMQKYLENINKRVAEDRNFKLVGMNDEILGLEIALAGRTKKSACLVGAPGVGKTSIVLELANRINTVHKDLPDMLSNVVIYELHMDALVAGATFRGEFEKRLKVILDAVSKLKNVILFIDEFHTAIKSGGSGGDAGGEMTGANIMKPYLSSGKIWVIGATTDDEYNEYVQKDKAISRRFRKVYVNEPTKEETLEIMRGVLPIDCEYFDKTMREELLDKIYTLSQQYNMDTYNPDKSLTMLESAFAYAKVCKSKEKEVVLDDMMHSLAIQYGINVSETKSEDTRKYAKKFLLGQDKPIDEICKYLDMIELNCVNPLKPRAKLLFCGSTGVGKTQMAKIIAEQFTGSENNLITVEGSTLQNETSINTLFGSDAGYVGYKATSDFLANVKQHPNCVVLFDEIEKAHPAVFKSLLNILDEGYARDKAGNKISFRNAIIIFTTNLGYGTTNHNGTGMMSRTANSSTALNEINKHFSPEFISRLDEVVTFNRLSNDIANELIERYRKDYVSYSGIDVKFTKSEIRDIKEHADIEHMGARNLDNLVKIAYVKKAMKERNK